MKEIVTKIVNEIKKQGLTASKVEEDTNIGKNTIATWKRGTQPTLEKILKVINYLELSADEVFGIDTKRNSLTYKPNTEWKLKATMKKTSEWLQYIIESNDIQEMHELARGLQIIINKEISNIKED